MNKSSHPEFSQSSGVPEPTRLSFERLCELLAAFVHETAPSGEALSRAQELRTLLPAAMSWFDRAKAVVATLTSSSESAPALAGVRYGGGSRQMSYAADGMRVDIEVDELDSTHCEIHGQIAGERQPAGGVVALVPKAHFSPVAVSRIDERGYFKLAASPGEYEIAVGVGTFTMLLTDCHLP